MFFPFYLLSPLFVLVVLCLQYRLNKNLLLYVMTATCIVWGLFHFNPFNAMMLPNGLYDFNKYIIFRSIIILIFLIVSIVAIIIKSSKMQYGSYVVLIIILVDFFYSSFFGRYVGP
jgi:hypothetical protein